MPINAFSNANNLQVEGTILQIQGGSTYTDLTSGLQTLISDGGGALQLPAGIFVIPAPLSFLAKNCWIIGSGPGTMLMAASGFSATGLLSITADYCGVMNLQIVGGPNNSSATNPVLNAIEATAARWSTFMNLEFSYINGWATESAATASQNISGQKFINIHTTHCAQGIHLLGNSNTNNVVQAFLTNIHLEQIDNGDGLFIEEANDVQIASLNGAVAGGAVAGSMIHVKGASSAIKFSIPDVGQLALGTTSPTMLVESSGAGSPKDVSVVGGVLQKGNTNLSITAGQDINFVGTRFRQANLDGVQLSQSTSPVNFTGCTWATNNQSGGTAYEINSTASAAYHVRDCDFESPVASATMGSVTNPINDTAHVGYYFNCDFQGSGTTPSNVFASGGTPQIVRSCHGYNNPRGQITAPSITTGTFNTSTSQNDVEIIFTNLNGGTISSFSVAGLNYGVPVLNVSYHAPARAAIQVVSSTAAPTWLWNAN